MSASFETVSATCLDEHPPADVLARLRELLLRELRSEAGQSEQSEQRRTRAEAQATTGAALGHFEVAWEIAEDGVAGSQEPVEDIEDALIRMDEGTYGVCEQRSALIPLERLVAALEPRRDAMR